MTILGVGWGVGETEVYVCNPTKVYGTTLINERKESFVKTKELKCIRYGTACVTTERSSPAPDEVDQPFIVRLAQKWISHFPDGASKPQSDT